MIDRQVLSRILPFAIYLICLGLADLLRRVGVSEAELRWFYPIKIILVVAALIYFWRTYVELAAPRVGALPVIVAVLGGVLVLVLWVKLDAGWMRLGANAGFDPRTNGNFDWPLVIVRLVGAALVVPVMEELFWRSFLARWIDSPKFFEVDPRSISLKAALISAALFGIEHSEWLAGIVAGLAYGWLYARYRSLWIPIVAHAVTNGLLGGWVIYTGQWTYW